MDFIAKRICDGRVMLIGGEQFGCTPGCDIFAIVYAQVEGSSSFSP